MSVTTVEGVVEGGRVRIVGDVQLPENARVYVVLPEADTQREGRKFDLAEMISRMPADYLVTEDSFGKPVGKEEW